MKSNLLVVIALTLVIGAVGGYFVSQNKVQNQENVQTQLSYGQGIGRGNGNSAQKQNRFNKQNCLAEDCLSVDNLDYPVGELAAETQKALVEAITDEYTAHATYESVIAKFGSVRPFSMIIRSEESHIASLKAIFDKYGLKIPADKIVAVAPVTLKEACQTGVNAEIANAALYRERLLPAVTAYPDITAVFTNLMNASQDKHLPAFERCN